MINSKLLDSEFHYLTDDDVKSIKEFLNAIYTIITTSQTGSYKVDVVDGRIAGTSVVVTYPRPRRDSGHVHSTNPSTGLNWKHYIKSHYICKKKRRF